MNGLKQRLPLAGFADTLRGWLGNRSIQRKLNTIVLAYVGVILVLVAFVIFCLNVQTGMRAYVQGNGLWTSGQKDAVYYLTRYARLHDENDFEKYRQAIAIPLGDRAARIELQKPEYDYAAAERGFLAGGNAPHNTGRLISMFRRFHELSYFETAIRIWTEADVEIMRLTEVADEIHATIAGGVSTPELNRQQLDRLEQINARLTPLEMSFASTLGEAAEWVRGLVIKAILLTAVLLLCGGLLVSTRISRRLRSDLQSLQAGTQRVAEGDLRLQIPVRSQDEIGALTRAFNDMIVQRRRVEDLVQHVAHHDALTDLPNRHLLLDRLSMAIKQARRTQKSIGVLMVDLDHFKRINDSLGHNRGDEVLSAVAVRLNAEVRNTDTVARFGGDEFVIVLPEISGREDAQKIALNIIESLSKAIRVGGHDLHISPSIGICLYPDDGGDSAALLKNADTAMYHAKAMGRNSYQWFDRQMLKLAEHKLEMEGQMRRALKNDEFLLYYQPLVSLNEHRIVGMEALIRWQHPQRGLITPDQFIPLAEETGLILPIGAWVLHQACIETQRMRRQTGQSLNIAVNVSTQQFQQAHFLGTVEDALAASGLPPEALTIEITESVLAQNPTEMIKLLHEIRDLGVSVAVDDFGTGYSSLSYVTRFPIAKLKIDRSFVSEISLGSSGDAVTSTIITMAHSLNLKVVAEGVENQEQLRFLDARACDEAQGHLFSPALDGPAFLKLAQSSSRLH